MKQLQECIFCQIATGSSPSRVLIENEHCVAFLDRAPASKGHTLVIPKLHSTDIFDTTSTELSEVMATVQQVSRLLFLKLNPNGVSIFQMNKEAGGQSVFHFHLHVVPRWYEDNLVNLWDETLASDLELANIRQEILADL